MRAIAVTPNIQVEIVEIGHQMKLAGLPNEFIGGAVRTAFEFEGVYDLLRMWSDETDEDQRNEIVADIQDLINDCSQQEKIEGVYIRFDDLDKIAENIRAFKDNLRMIVDQNGGIKQLSVLTGYPQPSLSRFFNSASMPRRSMLNRIARALGLNQVQIATEWSQ
jgi:hypothetical protein